MISLSFARVKEVTYEATKEKLYEIIRNLYSKYSFLLEENFFRKEEEEYYKKVLSDNPKETIITSSIFQLTSYLHRYYGKKVIILLDEYDTPMQEAYVNGFWDKLVSFTRSMFNSTFKTNPRLERGIMTGITRVSRESIFSDLNHLKVVTTTSDEYATSFGFTEEEVFSSLEEFGLGKEKEKVKFWYDGFVFGKHTDIYNSWSIINFWDTGKYDTYWANTSANSLTAKLIREGNRRIKMSLEQLLQGEHIRCSIEEQMVYNRLGDNEEAIWSLLTAGGYLKILSYDRADLIEDEDVMYELALTNYEVKRMFRGLIKDWFGTVKADYNDFIKALLKGNVKEMNAYMNRVALQTFSYFDTGKGPMGEEPERFYHGLVLGLLVELA